MDQGGIDPFESKKRSPLPRRNSKRPSITDAEDGELPTRHASTSKEECGASKVETMANIRCPRNNKKMKNKNQTKGNQSERQSPKATGPIVPTANKKRPLFDSLGREMADRMVNNVKAPESMDFVERLSNMDRLATVSDAAGHPSGVSLGSQVPTTTSFMASIQGTVNQIVHECSCSAAAPAPAVGTSFAQTYKRPKKRNGDINTFTLDEFAALFALSSLVERFGRVSHMGILDPSYSFFINQTRDAALSYKVQNKITVVGGDPLCRPDQYSSFLDEFRRFRKQNGWGIAFLGATDSFVKYARHERKCVTMRFGTERVLNPLTNTVLREKEGKRIVKQNKALLDPERGGIRIDTYIPSHGKNRVIQEQLVDVYNRWRENRNQSGRQLQAYITVFDPFALPDLMIYIYTTDSRSPNGRPNGFAALRKIGANNGYHIDPCCATPDAPRGITDLLIFAAMSLLNRAGVGYLSFGFEPSSQLQRSQMAGMNRPMAHLAEAFYRRCFGALNLSGKKAFHDKWKTDGDLESGLHLVFPDGPPGRRHGLAVLHIANISARQLLKTELGVASNKARRDQARRDRAAGCSATGGCGSGVDSAEEDGGEDYTKRATGN